MKLKAHVNQLGPITNIDLDLNQTILLMGASGLGKSYTAFLLQYMSGLFVVDGITIASLNLRLSSFIRKQMYNNGNNELYDFGINSSGESNKFLRSIIDKESKSKITLIRFSLSDVLEWMKDDIQSYLSYLLGYEDFDCDIDFKFQDIKYNLDDEHRIEVGIKEQDEDDNLAFYYHLNDYSNEHNFYNGNIHPLLTIILIIAKEIGSALNNHLIESFLFPPARGGFLNLKSIATKKISDIGMYNVFLENMDYLRGPREIPSDDLTLYNEATEQLLEGKIKEQEGIIFLGLKNGKTIPISAAASSIKELVPIMLLLKKYGDKLDKFSILFEEPEAHLHTSKQLQIANLITKCIRKGTRFVITTHSDYFLGRINQLIRIGNFKHKSETLFNEFCKINKWDTNLYLNKDDITAYYFREGENGITKVENFNIDDGIPFKTFKNSIYEQMKIDRSIEDFQEKESDD